MTITYKLSRGRFKQSAWNSVRFLLLSSHAPLTADCPAPPSRKLLSEHAYFCIRIWGKRFREREHGEREKVKSPSELTWAWAAFTPAIVDACVCCAMRGAFMWRSVTLFNSGIEQWKHRVSLWSTAAQWSEGKPRHLCSTRNQVIYQVKPGDLQTYADIFREVHSGRVGNANVR